MTPEVVASLIAAVPELAQLYAEGGKYKIDVNSNTDKDRTKAPRGVKKGTINFGKKHLRII